MNGFSPDLSVNQIRVLPVLRDHHKDDLFDDPGQAADEDDESNERHHHPKEEPWIREGARHFPPPGEQKADADDLRDQTDKPDDAEKQEFIPFPVWIILFVPGHDPYLPLLVLESWLFPNLFKLPFEEKCMPTEPLEQKLARFKDTKKEDLALVYKLSRKSHLWNHDEHADYLCEYGLKDDEVVEQVARYLQEEAEGRYVDEDSLRPRSKARQKFVHERELIADGVEKDDINRSYRHLDILADAYDRFLKRSQ